MSAVQTSLLGIAGDTAVISACGLYRYLLTRELGGTRTLVFVLLNPSIADATVTDPTLRRCMAFARAWGFGRVVLVNLFAYRATDPKAMLAALKSGVDIIGSENDAHVIEAVRSADRVVLGWGANAARRPLRSRAADVVRLVRDHYTCGIPPLCFRVTDDGCPEHPLMVPGAVEPIPFPGAGR
jgi:hypothetical protein